MFLGFYGAEHLELPLCNLASFLPLIYLRDTEQAFSLAKAICWRPLLPSEPAKPLSQASLPPFTPVPFLNPLHQSMVLALPPALTQL